MSMKILKICTALSNKPMFVKIESGDMSIDSIIKETISTLRNSGKPLESDQLEQLYNHHQLFNDGKNVNKGDFFNSLQTTIETVSNQDVEVAELSLISAHSGGINILIKQLRDNAKLPNIAREGDAGFDCYISAFFKIHSSTKKLLEYTLHDIISLKPNERIACGLGFSTAIPKGYYASVVPRSGLALWNGITITNTPGTIDSGYRDEWKAIISNISLKTVNISISMKICQFIIKKLVDINLKIVTELPESERDMGGFGSTDNV